MYHLSFYCPVQEQQAYYLSKSLQPGQNPAEGGQFNEQEVSSDLCR